MYCRKCLYLEVSHTAYTISSTHTTHHSSNVQPPTYLEHITTAILAVIRSLLCATPNWHPRHLASIHQHTYIEIKSHQVQQNGLPHPNRQPQPCLALAHANHWADITADIPTQQPPYTQFPCPTSNYRIRSPLYTPSFNLNYGLYPIDSDVSAFLHQLYQDELLARLVTKPEMGWYARHAHELELSNRTIGYTGSIHRLLIHQATSWTQHLYKSQTARTLVAQTHHPPEQIKPTTMKTCPFCTTPLQTTGLQPLLYGDSVHLHNHCTNQHITLTKHRSNVYIAHVIQALSTLLSNTPYEAPTHHTTFRTILLTGLYYFDDSPYTSISSNPCTTPLPAPIPTK